MAVDDWGSIEEEDPFDGSGPFDAPLVAAEALATLEAATRGAVTDAAVIRDAMQRAQHWLVHGPASGRARSRFLRRRVVAAIREAGRLLRSDRAHFAHRPGRPVRQDPGPPLGSLLVADLVAAPAAPPVSGVALPRAV